MTAIVTLPGDGIGPEIMAAARELLDRVGDFDLRRAHHRRRLDRRARHRPHRRGAGRLRRRRRRAACRRRRAEVGRRGGRRRFRTAPGAGAPRPAQGARPVRQPAARPAVPGPAGRQPAQAGADRGHRPPGGARADGRHLLRRRPGATATRAHDDCAYSVEEIERIARVAFRSARTQGHERGQGQRARDLTAVARDRDARACRGVRRASHSTTCSWTTPRCSSSPPRRAST